MRRASTPPGDRLRVVLLFVVTAVLAVDVEDVSAQTCVDPISFGATVRDGVDDRAAIQAAWNFACANNMKLCMPEGSLAVSRVPAGGVANIASITLTCANPGYTTSCTDKNGSPIVGWEIQGQGMNKSSLTMLGDGTFPGSAGPRPWTLLKPTSISGLCIRDLTLDGSQRGPTHEQTHLLEAVGPVTNMAVERIAAVIPNYEDGNDGGDCIRTVGTDLLPVTGTVVRDVLSGPCYRVPLILQRGTFDSYVEDSWFYTYRARQAMDMEASAGGQVDGVEIKNSTFTRTHSIEGVTVGFTIGFDGVGDGTGDDQPIRNVSFTDCVVDEGGFLIDDVENLTLTRLDINSRVVSTPTIQMLKYADNILCIDCTLSRATAGQIVESHRQDRTPNDITFVRGSFYTNAAAFMVYAEGLNHLTMDGTVMTYAGPATVAPMIKFRGLTADSDVQSVTLRNVTMHPGLMDGAVDVVVSAGGTAGPVLILGSWIYPVGSFYFTSVTGSTSQPPSSAGNLVQ